MRAKKYWMLAVTLTVCVGVLWAAERSEEKSYNILAPLLRTQGDLLKGLEGVDVFVTDSSAKAQRHLSEGQIQNDVELLLRKSGIKVLDEEWLDTPGWPSLRIGVRASINKESKVCALAVNVSLIEWVQLTRNPEIVTSATTWNGDRVTLVSLLKLKSHRRAKVKELVEIFIEDYLAANPKEQEKKTGVTLEEYLKPKDEQKQ
jgi:hypothetical protein